MMARPSHDYARLEPMVRRLHADGHGVQRIARQAGISVGSAHGLIGRLGLTRPVAPAAARRRPVRRPMPVGMGLVLGGINV
ncbi:hypothetical protein [Gluconobacter oxydans]|uniref:hypothetical protein n=1 Tax=Gluconobacter oxydans TaxID=442 RepID=UPI0007856F0D|nr:hypothetical protein [Gluconobacter oxydans]KXV65628.1 hypothetical protein AD950_04050 [Gluconobacter oxydans]